MRQRISAAQQAQQGHDGTAEGGSSDAPRAQQAAGGSVPAPLDFARLLAGIALSATVVYLYEWARQTDPDHKHLHHHEHGGGSGSGKFRAALGLSWGVVAALARARGDGSAVLGGAKAVLLGALLVSWSEPRVFTAAVLSATLGVAVAGIVDAAAARAGATANRFLWGRAAAFFVCAAVNVVTLSGTRESRKTLSHAGIHSGAERLAVALTGALCAVLAEAAIPSAVLEEVFNWGCAVLPLATAVGMRLAMTADRSLLSM